MPDVRPPTQDLLAGRLAVSVEEMTKLLPLNRYACYRLARELGGVKVGERILVPKERIEALLRGEVQVLTNVRRRGVGRKRKAA